MKRIKNIEVLRIFGCFAIIMFHLFSPQYLMENFGNIHLYSLLDNMTKDANKAVELFFILSGVFFAITYKSQQSIREFIKRKLIRLYPVLLFSIVLSFIFSLFGLMKFKFYDNLLSLFLLNGTPLSISNSNIGVHWYIGALFWTLLLLFYFKKFSSEKTFNLFVTISIFISYSIIIHFNHGKIYGFNRDFYNIINIGILRAIGGIGIGYFIGEWYKNNSEKIKKMVVNTKTTILLTVIEILCAGFIIKNLILYHLHYANQIIYVLIFGLTIILLLLNKGYMSQYFNKDIFVSLSKYTYSLFLTHQVTLYGIKNCVWKIHPDFVNTYPALNIVLTLSIVLIIGILTYHLIEKPATKYLKEKWQ